MKAVIDWQKHPDFEDTQQEIFLVADDGNKIVIPPEEHQSFFEACRVTGAERLPDNKLALTLVPQIDPRPAVTALLRAVGFTAQEDLPDDILYRLLKGFERMVRERHEGIAHCALPQRHYLAEMEISWNHCHRIPGVPFTAVFDKHPLTWLSEQEARGRIKNLWEIPIEVYEAVKAYYPVPTPPHH